METLSPTVHCCGRHWPRHLKPQSRNITRWRKATSPISVTGLLHIGTDAGKNTPRQAPVAPWVCRLFWHASYNTKTALAGVVCDSRIKLRRSFAPGPARDSNSMLFISGSHCVDPLKIYSASEDSVDYEFLYGILVNVQSGSHVALARFCSFLVSNLLQSFTNNHSAD